MPDVSVIIPLYNKGRLVARALDSVFAQTFRDFEAIVVDDGSTDDGPDTVRSYDDPRLRLIHQPNSGPGAARNRGVRESSALAVAFLDADDEWLPGFLEKSLENLRQNPLCALSVTNHYRGDMKVLGTSLPPCDVGITDGSWRLRPEAGPTEIWSALFYVQSGGCVTCRRDVFRKYGGSYEHGCTHGEDQYLLLQILFNHPVYRDTTPLWWYHTEASDLYGPRRVSAVPPFPWVADPDPIRRVCPPEFRGALEDFLAYTAYRDFRMMFGRADWAAAKDLLRHYSLAKPGGAEFYRLRIKMMGLRAFPFLRPLKRFLFGK
jgi:glycosyltransferase involved in cell wall biosynthesis